MDVVKVTVVHGLKHKPPERSKGEESSPLPALNYLLGASSRVFTELVHQLRLAAVAPSPPPRDQRTTSRLPSSLRALSKLCYGYVLKFVTCYILL